MLELVHTGAISFGALQTDPSKSLGGFISSSPIYSDFSGNLFSDISKNSVANDFSETKIIAIRNVSPNTLTGLKVYFDYPEGVDTVYSIGHRPPTVDASGNLFLEKIGNPQASPMGVQLYEADGEPNAINLPDLDPNEYLGIFIKRRLLSSITTPPTNEDLWDNFLAGNTLQKNESIPIVFSWD